MSEIEKRTYPLSERKSLQLHYGIHTLPFEDLSDATYCRETGESIIVDVIATDEEEAQAILSCQERGERVIWHAYRDQNGTPGTWRWTPEQLQDVRFNPRRIDDEENEFASDAEADMPIVIAPLHPDPKTALLMLGLFAGETDAEVQEKLEDEGLSPHLPDDYRTTWLAGVQFPLSPTPQQPLSKSGKPVFSGKHREKGRKKRR